MPGSLSRRLSHHFQPDCVEGGLPELDVGVLGGDGISDVLYNRLSQPTQVTYPKAGVAATAAQDPGRVVATQYDNGGRISAVTSAGGFSAQMETGSNPGGGADAEGYAAHGAIQRLRYDNGLVEWRSVLYGPAEADVRLWERGEQWESAEPDDRIWRQDVDAELHL